MDLQELENRLATTNIPTILNCPKEGVVHIAPSEALDMPSAHLMESLFRDVISIGYVNIVLDMEHINYAASMGIGTIINLLKDITKKNGKLIVINIQPKVLDVLNLLGFVKFLNIEKDLEAAVGKM
jgi:anti-anti-sigma factor